MSVMHAHNMQTLVLQNAGMGANGDVCANHLLDVRLHSLSLVLLVLGLGIIDLLLR